MWAIISAILSAIAAFFGSKSVSADKEQKKSVNVMSRTSADITRETEQTKEAKKDEAATENATLVEHVSNSDSLQHGSDLLNEAIRRANGKSSS